MEKSLQQDLKIELKKISISKFLRLLIDEINEEALKERQVLLFLPSQEIFVFTDESLVAAVIRNLVQNAVNYSPNSKNPEVHVTFSEQQWEIKVKDFGIGIPKEDQDNIFRSFYRAGNVGNINGTWLEYCTIAHQKIERLGMV